MGFFPANGITSPGNPTPTAMLTNIGHIDLMLASISEHLEDLGHVLDRVTVETYGYSDLSLSGQPVAPILGSNSKLSVQPGCIDSELKVSFWSSRSRLKIKEDKFSSRGDKHPIDIRPEPEASNFHGSTKLDCGLSGNLPDSPSGSLTPRHPILAEGQAFGSPPIRVLFVGLVLGDSPASTPFGSRIRTVEHGVVQLLLPHSVPGLFQVERHVFTRSTEGE